jgi:hypothetical protein
VSRIQFLGCVIGKAGDIRHAALYCEMSGIQTSLNEGGFEEFVADDFNGYKF